MTFKNDQLQLALNYDTNGKECLTFDERCEIHRAISRKMTYDKPYEFDSKSGIKIINILGEINQSGYQYRNEQYYVDPETQSVKSKLV